MTGIQYVTDEKGRKVAVQIDLKTHRSHVRRFPRRLGVSIAPQGKEHSLRAIPCEPREASPPTWLDIPSKSNTRRKRNWMRSTMRCLLASTRRFWRWQTTHGRRAARSCEVLRTMANSER